MRHHHITDDQIRRIALCQEFHRAVCIIAAADIIRIRKYYFYIIGNINVIVHHQHCRLVLPVDIRHFERLYSRYVRIQFHNRSPAPLILGISIIQVRNAELETRALAGRIVLHPQFPVMDICKVTGIIKSYA